MGNFLHLQKKLIVLIISILSFLPSSFLNIIIFAYP